MQREACLVEISTGSLSDTVTLGAPQGNPSDEMTLKSKEIKVRDINIEVTAKK